MRKIIAISLLFFVSIFSLFADDEVIFSDRPGSYAIYQDLRFGNEALIGLCYVGENTILARSYEPASENELLLMIELTVKEGNIDLGEHLQVLAGSMNSSDAAARLIPMIMNWAITWYKSKSIINEKTSYSVSTDDDYNYLSWIPVFQLDHIGNKKDFSVFAIGFLNSFSDERFFGFTKLPEAEPSDKYTIKKGKKNDVTIDDLIIPLDSNWKTEDNRVYRITTKSPQDAVFMVETFNYLEAGLSDIRELAQILLIGNMDILVLAEGTKIEIIDDTYNLTMRMYDPRQNKITIQQTQIFDRGEGYVSVASLACYETLYLKNQKYFDKIMH